MSIREDELALIEKRKELNEKINSLYHFSHTNQDYIDAVKELKRVELKLKKIDDLKEFIIYIADTHLGVANTQK